METLLTALLISGIYLTLGAGVLDLFEELARREDDDPPEKILTLLVWPVALAIIAITRLDKR